MNTLILKRYTHDHKPTLGGLYYKGDLICGTVEDPKQERKIAGRTRIPAGSFAIVWRTVGKWAARFQAAGYPGSLEISNVPNFAAILIHIGNDAGDTEGCVPPNTILFTDKRTGGQSRQACERVYDLVHKTDGPWVIQVEG